MDSIRWWFVDHDDGNFAIPTIAQSDTDAAAMPLLGEHVPDFADLLGPNCVAILNSGRKLELEALLRRRDATRQQNQDWEYVDRGVWDTAA